MTKTTKMTNELALIDQFNPNFLPIINSKAKYLIVMGGAGSSKSVSVAQKELDIVLHNKQERLLVIRKVARTIRNSTFALFKDIIRDLEWTSLFRIVKDEMYLKAHDGGEIIHAGLDDAEKLKSIARPTRIWIEEATELTIDDLAQVDLRLRGVPDPQITFTLNPVYEANRIFEYVKFPVANIKPRSYVEDDDIAVHHSTYLDNPWVDPNEYLKTFRRIGGTLQRIYEHGELAIMDEPNQVIKYQWIKAARELHPERVNDGRSRLGVDIGRFGNDPSVLAYMDGRALKTMVAYQHEDVTNISNHVLTFMNEKSISPEYTGVDGVGIGAGVVDNLWHHEKHVVEIISGASPLEFTQMDYGDVQFKNLRAQMWWYARYMLENAQVAIALPEDESYRLLQEELLSARYRYAADHKIEIEPKESATPKWGIRQRIGRSTDYADAFLMALFVDQMYVHDNSYIEQPDEEGVFAIGEYYE